MGRLFLRGAQVFDGSGATLTEKSVVVSGGSIEAVESPGVLPGGDDEVVDLSGRTLLPGMVQGHFHTTYHQVGATGGNFGVEEPPAMQAFRAGDHLRKALRAGFTSAVGASSSFDIDPSCSAAQRKGLIDGARLVPASRDVLTTGDSNDVVPWWMESRAEGVVRLCDGADAFRKGVREEIKRGARIIKLYASGGHGVTLGRDTVTITRAEMEAAVTTAHDRGVRVRAHVANKRALMQCLELGVDIIDHGDGLDDEGIAAMVERGAFWLPSLYLPLVMLQMQGDADMVSGFNSELGQEFRETCEILPRAAEAGVRICVGDDFGSVVTPHGDYAKELAVYVDHAGIAPAEVLRWASSIGGELVGRGDLGRIEAGCVADLVVVDGDPTRDITVLQDLERIVGVMQDGRFFVDPRA